MIRLATPKAIPLLLAAALLGNRPLRAQTMAENPRVREALGLLDLWIDAQVAYGQIPGASAAVVHDQELVWAKGFGLANREAGVPATPGTVFSICSISKLFTSIGVLQQRDAGRLRLDDPVRDHLPWFRIREAHSGQGPATVEGLLTHSAGLPRESNHPYWSAPDFIFPTREEIMEGVPHQETLYPAATYSQYSNLGLTLAGEILAAVSGMPFDRYVRENILEPLGMSRTWTEIPTDLWGREMAVGYSAITREGTRIPMPVFQARGIAPAAGFASTVEDLARFASWQFRLLSTQGSEVLDANTLREMHRVHWVDPGWETTWGLGFTVFRHGDRTFVGHGGSCPGYRSHLALETRGKVATVFMANALGVNPNEFTARAYDLVAPAFEEASDPDRTAAEPNPALEKYTGTYGQSFGGETAVIPWKGGLAMVYLPTEDPLAGLTRLRHIQGDTFRRIREDDALGEEIIFEVRDGAVARMWRHNNFMTKVR